MRGSLVNSGARIDRRLSVAPMMDWTDRHERFFLRQITRRTMLYTEMITSGAILHGDRERLLAYDPCEHPVGLQVGGADPEALSRCAEIAASLGYDEINLNVGCPSDRVQSGQFGACLMAEPDRVAACATAMIGFGIPVTVKCRIGIDGREDYEDLLAFVEAVRQGGVASFAVHARIAVLEGLSAKENREIPPLRYADVYRLKAECPELEIIINGGIRDLGEAAGHLEHVDGVMIGRAAYQNPWMLAAADRAVFGETGSGPSPDEVIARVADYAEAHLARGGRLSEVTRHILGLFQGVPGARAWRRHLSENAHRPGAGVDVLFEAAAKVPAEIRSARGDVGKPREATSNGKVRNFG
ncbi:MAG TPA: tRNA dihydrouridine(20/20a) synthase DusA [Alphaproteobacteria bacterium]|nr:tRNA dihydrouridine(20/20a) synthase DusA [Alphaproteobacteria bacterium]